MNFCEWDKCPKIKSNLCCDSCKEKDNECGVDDVCAYVGKECENRVTARDIENIEMNVFLKKFGVMG